MRYMMDILHNAHDFIQALAKSHYRVVARWEIFMEQELRFGLDLGRFSNFLGRFFRVFIP